ncbi:MAG: hypothetical protein WD533_07335 [Dehalococcoidia bacterium]
MTTMQDLVDAGVEVILYDDRKIKRNSMKTGTYDDNKLILVHSVGSSDPESFQETMKTDALKLQNSGVGVWYEQGGRRGKGGRELSIWIMDRPEVIREAERVLGRRIGKR